ncbi:coiled-coil domain-containing protein [Paenibacillus senegalensis]|uniref:hypothetical protein n=1 Tax=Paenibacillus senegalensis TaxID=1465766 RepID=UPI0002886054|nr:hypothetical protein [Paenibacillus senegalensis]
MPYIDWERRYEEWAEASQLERKWRNELQSLEKEIEQQKEEEAYWRRKLREYSHERDKLDKLSWSNLFHTLTLKKREQINEWDEAVVRAKLKYEETAATVRDMEQEIQEKRQSILQLGDLERKYNRLLEEKKQLIEDHNSIMNEKLYTMLQEKEVLRAYLKELREAIHVGETVISALQQAERSMGSARNWGTYDMLGGGMIATAIKRSKMNDGNSYIHEAQKRMRRFEKELQDVQHYSQDFKAETGSLLTFADYFFDGLIVDWLVQNKIVNSLNEVNRQIRNVSSILNQLRQQERVGQSELEGKQAAYKSMIIKAGS